MKSSYLWQWALNFNVLLYLYFLYDGNETPMVTPTFLEQGDTVGIVSTARKLDHAELKPGLDILDSWGLNYVLGETIASENHQFAGNDAVRTADFQRMLDDPKIKAIWCARGGYGTVRIIDQLDFSNFLQKPKWIIGYSDITVLHSHIHNFGIETLHAQMLLDIENKTLESTVSIKKCLFGEDYSISFSSETELNRKGEAKGQLVGGNLSVLYSLCGSNSAINTDGKILFLEDLDEYLYHIDRMMQNLKRSGMLNDLAALVVGGMTDMNDNTIPFGKTAEEIIAETVSAYDYPVVFGCPAGHTKDNRALVMGRGIRLEFHESRATLTFNL